MNRFYSKLTTNPDDLSPILEAYDYYMEEFEAGRLEMDKIVAAKETVFNAARFLPGIWSRRYDQLQEIEQLLRFLENNEKRVLGAKRRLYREHYQRELTDSMVEKYAETDTELLDLVELRNMFALVRNKFLALTKNHEALHFQITNVTKLAEHGAIETTTWGRVDKT